MTSFRIERVNKEMQRLISEILRVRVKNEEVKGAIITGVACSRDLEHAKVFFTTIAPRERDGIRKALEQTAGVVRGFLGKAMRIRQIPELHFVADDTEDRARHLDELLDRLSREGGQDVGERGGDDDEESDDE